MTPPREPRTDRYSEAVAALMPFADHRFVNGKPCRVGTDDGCTCGYHDALTLVDRAEAAGAPLREALKGLVDTWDLYGTIETNQWGDRAIHQPWIDALKQARAALAATPAPAPLDRETLRTDDTDA